MKRLLVLALLAAALVACGQAETIERIVEVTRIVEVEIEVTREVEVIREVEVQVEVPVEVLVEVTPEPTSVPQSFVFLDYEGLGEGGIVTDNFAWPACQKAVFIAERTTESGNFIVYGINVDTGERWNIVIMGRDEDRSETLAPLIGGTYYLEIDSAPTGPWSVMGECRD